MSHVRDFVCKLEVYGIRLTVIDADANIWEVHEDRGAAISPPIRLGLHSDEAVAEYIERYREPGMRSGLPLEPAMMNVSEVIESTNGVDDEPVFAAFLLHKRPGSAVEQVWERRKTRPLPVVGDPDLKWRAYPGPN